MFNAGSIAYALALPWRVLLLLVLAAVVHFLALVIKRYVDHVSSAARGRGFRKLRSISTLATSILVFTAYFLTLGLILGQFGVSLTAFFASASVIGLAVGFGSQGLVQDVVTGLTLIFSDLIDVGDLVELSGQTGLVEGITMRFVRLRNALGAEVFIPNRTISSVINYPRGYVRCIVDVTLLGDAVQRAKMRETTERFVSGFREQFPAMFMAAPSVEGERRLESGKQFLRLRLPLWPDRAGAVEAILRAELTEGLKREHADYAPWMVAVSYEAETRPATARIRWLPGGRRTVREPKPASPQKTQEKTQE